MREVQRKGRYGQRGEDKKKKKERKKERKSRDEEKQKKRFRSCRVRICIPRITKFFVRIMSMYISFH